MARAGQSGRRAPAGAGAPGGTNRADLLGEAEDPAILGGLGLGALAGTTGAAAVGVLERLRPRGHREADQLLPFVVAVGGGRGGDPVGLADLAGDREVLARDAAADQVIGGPVPVAVAQCEFLTGRPDGAQSADADRGRAPGPPGDGLLPSLSARKKRAGSRF